MDGTTQKWRSAISTMCTGFSRRGRPDLCCTAMCLAHGLPPGKFRTTASRPVDRTACWCAFSRGTAHRRFMPQSQAARIESRQRSGRDWIKDRPRYKGRFVKRSGRNGPAGDVGLAGGADQGEIVVAERRDIGPPLDPTAAGTRSARSVRSRRSMSRCDRRRYRAREVRARPTRIASS